MGLHGATTASEHKAEAKAGLMGTAVGAGLAAAIAYAKANDMTKAEFLDLVSQRWERWDQQSSSILGALQDFARSVGMHDDQR